MSKCIDFHKSSVRLLDGIELDDKDYPVHFYGDENQAFTKIGHFIGFAIIKGSMLLIDSTERCKATIPESKDSNDNIPPCNPKFHDEKPHWKTEQKNLFE